MIWLFLLMMFMVVMLLCLEVISIRKIKDKKGNCEKPNLKLNEYIYQVNFRGAF